MVTEKLREMLIQNGFLPKHQLSTVQKKKLLTPQKLPLPGGRMK